LIIFDAETNTVFKSPKIATEKNFETFPCWSPDGKSLYFCSARALPQDKFDQIRYDLLRIAFNPGTMQLGEIDTIISANRIGKSISFPRISPDGKYLMFCMSNYGNFSIWHKESDLYLLNLESKEITKLDINSDQTESYHQWSSNGRWIVFSSRRRNGLYTRPYFSCFDKDGNAQKPFLLPQKDPGFYEDFLKSYNVPEFVTSKVDIDPRDLYEVIRSKPESAKVEYIK
jgi:dipeptidyl aminopeptidase/acylaminoacyl peptidase